ncbi:SMP-30/gluconolactonase/LRE family protein, partial [Mycobacterium sp.]|uniref:SMP-30/gluconolactonase/LRE family protein n=1 Tax=Mycobacterium sp. TaxID=1785 RepID=UPI002DA768FB|nr:SMP-30/gluconolactonase/LRE family protein [Mycobacterium sp.]
MSAQPKPPVDPVRWQPPSVDPLPEFGPAELTVVPVPGNAPEDVVVDGDGQIWTGVDDGRIVRISQEGGEPSVVADTGGRPLGLAVARDGRLLICNSPGGLLALDPSSGKVETLVEEVDGRRLQFCSNVTEMPDGTIFFTESTSAFTYAHFKGAVLEARPRGSLFRRDPDGTVLTVVPGLYFANGVTPTADGSALVFAETM